MFNWSRSRQLLRRGGVNSDIGVALGRGFFSRGLGGYLPLERHMRVRPFRGFLLLASAAALAALVITSGCSQDEQVTPGASVSPYVPNPNGQASSANNSLAAETDLPLPDGLVAQKAKSDDPLDGASSPGKGSLDTSFGANDVEKTLRTAMRTARNGDPAKAAVLLDQVLVAEPLNREALMMRAAINFEAWHKEKSPEAPRRGDREGPCRRANPAQGHRFAQVPGDDLLRARSSTATRNI